MDYSFKLESKMPKKRGLITDTYKMVRKEKKTKQEEDEEKAKEEVARNLEIERKQLESNLEVLKQFDLFWEYGPCIGITRLQRWERADILGLKPPVHVRDLILKHKDDPLYLQSLWHEYPL
ncbi:DNA polymerase delta subunit 4 [Latimeria chalumnae]|uniref:DNA polymerase delta subunit 4 n=1 Tax=Latimeria chalumnae TaxID=7897 RepID=UPI00313B54AA